MGDLSNRGTHYLSIHQSIYLTETGKCGVHEKRGKKQRKKTLFQRLDSLGHITATASYTWCNEKIRVEITKPRVKYFQIKANGL